MAASIYDLYIEQGATFTVRIRLYDDTAQPIDLTGYTARSQIRQSLLATAILHEMTTQNQGIKISVPPTDGYLDLIIPAVTTAAFKFSSPAVWDLELVSPTSEVTRLLKGTVALDPEVTR